MSGFKELVKQIQGHLNIIIHGRFISGLTMVRNLEPCGYKSGLDKA